MPRDKKVLKKKCKAIATKKIVKNIREGRERKQAIAIGISQARKSNPECREILKRKKSGGKMVRDRKVLKHNPNGQQQLAKTVVAIGTVLITLAILKRLLESGRTARGTRLTAEEKRVLRKARDKKRLTAREERILDDIVRR